MRQVGGWGSVFGSWWREGGRGSAPGAGRVPAEEPARQRVRNTGLGRTKLVETREVLGAGVGEWQDLTHRAYSERIVLHGKHGSTRGLRVVALYCQAEQRRQV